MTLLSYQQNSASQKQLKIENYQLAIAFKLQSYSTASIYGDFLPDKVMREKAAQTSYILKTGAEK
jgi:hypothetical protein